MDTDKILAAQLLKSEQIIASYYSTLETSKGLPAPDDLKRLHPQINSEVAKLTKIVRDQPDAIKLAIKAEHLRVHRAIKLLAGDLFLVELEAALTAPPVQPPAKSAEQLAREAFEAFLRDWVGASPLIHPDTAAKLWPKVNNNKALGSYRLFGENIGSSEPKPVSPLELARDAIRRELRRVSLNPSDPVLSHDTIHLAGMAYVLAQVELAMRYQNDDSYENSVSGWYEAAQRPMAVIQETVGCLDRPILETIRDGDPFSLDRLQRSRRDLIATMMCYYSVPDWSCATLAGFPQAPGLPTHIVGVNNVTEKTKLRDGLVYNDLAASKQTMLGYLADTGLPLIFPRRGEKPASEPPKRFGRLARAVAHRAHVQFVEQYRQIRFSVSETVSEQHELIADLIALEPVRDAFKKSIKKEPRIDLIDRKSRGAALRAVMRSVAPQLSPDQALLVLIAFIRRYLQFFTRHTGDNMRDTDPPYLSSTWPTDLSGRQFFDCGIYAVETAFDLMRIANAAKGMTLKFRFLLIPEHIALVIYHEETSFCVNNADIFDPRPFPVAKIDREVAAGLVWAREITQPLYGSRFAIFAAGLTPKALSSRTSEPLFKSSIWPMYKSLMGFGITEKVRPDYFETLKSFSAGCSLLCGYLIELMNIEPTGASKKDLADSFDQATALTDHLYVMIELLAHPVVYSDDNNLGLKSTIVAHVSGDDVLVQRTQLGRRLPVYQFIDFLKRSGITANAAQQKLIKRSTDEIHIGELNGVLEKGAPRTNKDFENLKAQFSAARAAIVQFVKNAPRIKALIEKG